MAWNIHSVMVCVCVCNYRIFHMPGCVQHMALVQVTFPTALQQGVTASLGHHDHRLATCSKKIDPWDPMGAMHLRRNMEKQKQYL